MDSDSESGSEVNEYEQQREERIATRKAYMVSIGLGPREKPAPKKRNRKIKVTLGLQGSRKSDRQSSVRPKGVEEAETDSTQKPRKQGRLALEDSERGSSGIAFLSPAPALGSFSSSSSSKSNSPTTTSPSSSATSATSSPSDAYESLEVMSLETYMAAVSQAVRPQFQNAEAFFESASNGKQLLSGLTDQVARDYAAFRSCRMSFMHSSQKRNVLESMISEQAETHYCDAASVTLLYKDLVALPSESWDRFLTNVLLLEQRRLGRSRQAYIAMHLTPSARAALPRSAAAVNKLFGESSEKEIIQTLLKGILYEDPFFFLKGRDHVMQEVCSSSSWCPSLTQEEKEAQLESYTDNAYASMKKYGKGQYDASKQIMKFCYFGGGGQKVPDYRNKYDKNVFNDPRKITLLVDLFNQTTTAVDPTEENRVKDLRNLVESLVKFVAYYRLVLDAKPSRLLRDSAFMEEFHARSHEDHCRYLEERRTSVFTLAFALHLILSGIGMYIVKQDAEVIVHNTALFKGSRAIQELVLHLIIAGQDNCRSKYRKQGSIWTYEQQPVGLAQRVVQVPGISLSQLDIKNQEALRFVHPILMHVTEDERPVRCKAVTSKGAFKDKVYPTDFLFAPVFMDGWPTPAAPKKRRSSFTEGSGQGSHFDQAAAEEEDDAEDEPEACEIDASLA